MTAASIWFSSGLLLAFCCVCNGSDSTAPTRVFFKPDAVTVGHQWTVPYEGREDFRLLTRSVDPYIVEIENFATKEECEAIMKTAEDGGFEKSLTSGGEFEAKDLPVSSPSELLEVMDMNGDQKIELNEVKVRMQGSADAYFSTEQISTLLQEAGIKLTDDGNIASMRNMAKHMEKFLKSVADFVKEHPENAGRFSKQVWLGDPVDGPGSEVTGGNIHKNILKKVEAITGLSEKIIAESEPLQVVRYGPKGHYHCHMDTGFEGTRWPRCCGPEQDVERCQICRFATMLFYLNDDPNLEGGATAFPGAYHSENITEDFERADSCRLESNCNTGIVVQPKQGKAVLWYNHKINESGLVGDADFRTHHGGCELKRGTKWIANLWMRFHHTDYFKFANDPEGEEGASGDNGEDDDFTGDNGEDDDFMASYEEKGHNGQDTDAASRPADEL